MPINSCKATKQINAFVYSAIPSPRDIFRKYGERLNDKGVYTASADDSGSPQLVSGGSVIDQMINAQRMLESDLDVKH